MNFYNRFGQYCNRHCANQDCGSRATRLRRTHRPLVLNTRRRDFTHLFNLVIRDIPFYLHVPFRALHRTRSKPLNRRHHSRRGYQLQERSSRGSHLSLLLPGLGGFVDTEHMGRGNGGAEENEPPTSRVSGRRVDGREQGRGRDSNPPIRCGHPARIGPPGLDISATPAEHPAQASITRDPRGYPMQQIAEDTRLPADIDAQPLVQAAAALRSVIRGYRDEIEREQRLPKALVEQLHAAGFYRLVMPRELGGLQADPLTYLRVVELLAEGAGSVGWNLWPTTASASSSRSVCRTRASTRSTRTGPTPSSPAPPCRGAGGRCRSTVAIGSPVAGASAAAVRRAPGCWAASRFSTATSRAAARTAPRSTGAGSSRVRKRRSSRGAGTCPGCARPAASTGRSRTSSCRSGGRWSTPASRSTTSGSAGRGSRTRCRPRPGSGPTTAP